MLKLQGQVDLLNVRISIGQLHSAQPAGQIRDGLRCWNRQGCRPRDRQRVRSIGSRKWGIGKWDRRSRIITKVYEAISAAQNCLVSKRGRESESRGNRAIIGLDVSRGRGAVLVGYHDACATGIEMGNVPVFF